MQNCSRLLRVVAVLSVVAAGACGSKSKGAVTPENGGGEAVSVPSVDPTLCDTAGKDVETGDLNKDNRPDVWKMYKKIDEGGTEVSVLTCKQVDLDYEGRKDYVAGYTKKGGLVFEKADLDYDGRFDLYAIYDAKTGKLVEVERDSGMDGDLDLKEIYDSNGAISAVRQDRNHDGNPDLWEQYVDGALVAILYDNDYDNKVDRREDAPGSRPKSNLPPPEPTPTPAPDAATPPTTTPAK